MEDLGWDLVVLCTLEGRDRARLDRRISAREQEQLEAEVVAVLERKVEGRRVAPARVEQRAAREQAA